MRTVQPRTVQPRTVWPAARGSVQAGLAERTPGIWLSPIYPSPMLDGGYDVMDHTAVDPVFGTLRTGELELVDVGDPDVLAYLRRAGDDTALVAVRFGLRGGEIQLPPGPWRVLLSSHDLATPTTGSQIALRPLEAIIIRPDAPTMDG